MHNQRGPLGMRERIRRQRFAAGLTQARVAEKARIARSKLSLYEAGDVDLTTEELRRVERALTKTGVVEQNLNPKLKRKFDRQETGMSQYELAKKAKISRTKLSAWENGQVELAAEEQDRWKDAIREGRAKKILTEKAIYLLEEKIAVANAETTRLKVEAAQLEAQLADRSRLESAADVVAGERDLSLKDMFSPTYTPPKVFSLKGMIPSSEASSIPDALLEDMRKMPAPEDLDESDLAVLLVKCDLKSRAPWFAGTAPPLHDPSAFEEWKKKRAEMYLRAIRKVRLENETLPSDIERLESQMFEMKKQLDQLQSSAAQHGDGILSNEMTDKAAANPAEKDSKCARTIHRHDGY